MNTAEIENSNSEIGEVEDIVIEEGDDAETIKQKVADYKAKLDDNNAQLYARTKKAEGFELVDGKWVKKATEKKQEEPQKKETKKETTEQTTTSQDTLSQSELIAIIKSNVPEEDIDEVKDFAKLKKISIQEALRSPLLKSVLEEKAEQRAVANGTSTNGSNRGNAKVSDEKLLSDASKGILPESDADMKRLTILQRAKR